ncbi:LPS export ABC transporter permease LptF [Shimia haliotis]|uniref:Lipopolysaccharide export system permease protein n=1 Tax=Shimia haliotis TaxID=1280847 RepID=A0A1I4AV84_9RHOB|nr:LPS export ABC transporter permease LptF [Shimia haliotis]SFK59546.1 lipopolysaccharide export system permease protein [Shimia haliotis]
MSRFDRYILSQLLTLFGFFALVLVSVYWVNRAVVLFDTLIASGQSVSVFLGLTVLSLPNVIRLVLPVAVFAATVYATNRLSSESELTVMQATGFSPWRLAKPVLFFGVAVALMMSVLTHFLVPSSLLELNKRQNEITANVTARLLTEGTFLHPTSGITFYIREISNDGVLRDVFLSDRRSPTATTTYTAAEAYLVNDATGPKLVMVNGLAQQHDTPSDQLLTTNFADFSYDISALSTNEATAPKGIKHISTRKLLTQAELVSEQTGRPLGDITYEAHGRIAQATVCIVFAIVAFAVLLLGGFSRFGMWRQILIAFVLLIVLEAAKTTVVDPVRKDADLWPLVYMPTLLGAVLGAFLLRMASGPLRVRRQAA